MRIQSNTHGDEPIRGELRLLLLLAALSPVGLMMWVGLFLAIHWSILTVWAAAVGI